MEYLLNKTNSRVLESFCFANTLFAFDYDGTLAPICENPKEAVMKPEVAQLLSRLMDFCPVALITGRSISDMEKLLPTKPKLLIGNHGSEGILAPEDLASMRASCDSWLRIISESAKVLQELGVHVENKEFSLTFHYRNSTSPEIARNAIRQLVTQLPGSISSGGKFVVNVLPERAIHKGKALELLMQKNNYQFAIYFGDDLTDEDVFRVRNPRLLTVKVGLEPSLARYYIRSQNEIEEVLKLLTEFFAQTTNIT